MKSVITVILILLVSAFQLLSEEIAFVLNGNARTVSKIDPATGTVQNDLITTGDVPNQIIATPDYVISVNSGTNDLNIFSADSLKLLATVFLGEGYNPWNAVIAGDSLLLVTNWIMNSVSVVNLNRLEIDTTFATGMRPEGILAIDDYILVTVTNYNLNDWTFGNGYLYIHDADDYSIIDSVMVGTNPQSLVKDADGYIHLLSTGDYFSQFGKVQVIDMDSLKIAAEIELGGSPGFMSISGTGIVYMSAGGWEYGGDEHGYVYSYDSQTLEILHDSQTPILTHRGVINIATDTEGRFWAACMEEDFVDVGFDSVITSYLVGDGPVSVAVSDFQGTFIDHSPVKDLAFRLMQNYPNPFNSSTTIPVELSEDTFVNLQVFDLKGALVKTLYRGNLSAGSYNFRWNAKNSRSEKVSSGIYLVRIQDGSSQKNRRIILQK